MLAEDPKLKFEGKALNKLTKILSVNEHGILKCLQNKMEISIFAEEMWTLVEEPVSLMEMLNSDGKCRVEHELIDKNLQDEISTTDEITLKDYENLKANKYMPLHNLMSVLPWILNSQNFKEVIKNGKWYLEEDERHE
ncbi:hypothetical protein [Clostridium botulinum]|nr:hypothetical protein [Clostridium botulinum]